MTDRNDRPGALHTLPGEVSVSLRHLLGADAGDAPDVAITDLTLDSRRVRPGAAFLALPGQSQHGIAHAAQAVAAGARVVLWDPQDAAGLGGMPALSGAALVAVPNLAGLAGRIADRFFQHPSARLKVAGVTGTNGKTTTAWLIAAALEHERGRAAYSGTLGFGRPGGALRDVGLTTPDVVTVHRRLAEACESGIGYVGMEVSSHALDQGRVAGVHFHTAVFTNLTRDHLDYHGTIAAYGAAKARLFAAPELEHAVVNLGDGFGRELARSLPEDVALTGYCLAEAGVAAAGTSETLAHARRLVGSQIVHDVGGLSITVEGSWGSGTLRSRLLGSFNAENLLAALATLLEWEVPLVRALEALGHCAAPPGRMETLASPGQALAVIDYAHTPDALEKALATVRRHCRGQVICVFGCGGDRDPGKRPQMGAIAERLADRVIVTDDNPRSEDSAAIIAAILAGMARPERVQVISDRGAAIAEAIASSGADDLILIAGKGHEDYQQVGRTRLPFSDRDCVRAAQARVVH